jgi:hypothetical protein
MMGYTAQAVFGCTGKRTLYMGMDLANLQPECALGEISPIDKVITLDKKVYVVGDLMKSDFGLKYDLILNMMLRDGVIDYDTKVKVGSEGRLREVYLVKEKEAYRIFGKTYYGKTNEQQN